MLKAACQPATMSEFYLNPTLNKHTNTPPKLQKKNPNTENSKHWIFDDIKELVLILPSVIITLKL